jgi:hypothetical protein
MDKTNGSRMLVMDILHYIEYNLKDENYLFLDANIHNNDRSLQPIIEIIEKKKPKVIFFNYPTECSIEWLVNWVGDDDLNINGIFNRDFFKLEKLLDDIDAKFYLILGGQNVSLHKNYHDGNTPLKRFKILYWPTYLITHTWVGLQNSFILHNDLKDKFKTPEQLSIDKKFDYLYINLNNKSRYHRCLMMDKLCENNLMKLGLNSWNLLSTDGMGSITDLDVVYESFDFKCWEEKKINIDDYRIDKDIVDEYTKKLLQPNALISLVTETFHRTNFITEKTFRPILLEQPFIVLGGKNQNKELINLGFELYDEIFDYTFDSEDSLEKRAQGIIDNFLKIKDENYYEVYEQLLPKIKRNKKRIIQLYNNDTFNPYLNFFNFWEIFYGI